MLNLFQYRLWSLSESYFGKMFPVVSKWLEGGHALDALVKKPTSAETFAHMQAVAGIDADAEFKLEWDRDEMMTVAKGGGKKIGLVSLIGPITKYGDLCSYGTRDYQGMIDRMNKSDNLDGMVLVMDSPGGTVDGTPELALTVKQSRKPIGVFGDHVVASAALWIASQAKVVVGNKNNPTEFGSIGTLVISENWQNVIKAGFYPNLEIIRAPQSTEKARFNPIEELSDETRAEIDAELKEITDQFIGAVKSGRGMQLNTKLDGLFAGKMFDVNTAKKNGLIDSVGTLHTAISKVAELARQQSKEGTNVQTNTSAEMKKYPRLSAFLGAAKALIFGGSEAKEVALTDEQAAALEASEKELTDSAAEIAQLKAASQAKDEKITALEATVSEQKAQITTLEGEKKTLQSKLDEKPKGELTTVVPNKDKEASNANESEGEKKGQYATSVDADAKKIREDKAKLSTYK